MLIVKIILIILAILIVPSILVLLCIDGIKKLFRMIFPKSESKILEEASKETQKINQEKIREARKSTGSYNAYLLFTDIIYGTLGALLALIFSVAIGFKNWPTVHKLAIYSVYTTYDWTYDFQIWYLVILGAGLGVVLGRLHTLFARLMIKIAKNTRLTCIKISGRFDAEKYKDYLRGYRLYVKLMILLDTFIGTWMGLDFWAGMDFDVIPSTFCGQISSRMILTYFDDNLWKVWTQGHPVAKFFLTATLFLAPFIGMYFGYCIGKIKAMLYLCLIDTAKYTRATYDGIVEKKRG